MVTTALLRSKFADAMPYDAYIRSGTPSQLDAWRSFERVARNHASLDSHQRSAMSDFARRVNVLVLSGLWCGDCVAQCPLLQIIAEGKPDLIDLRFLDRDAHADLAEMVMIAGGRRVPTAIFMNEDYEFVSLMGDKSLARLRSLASASLGPSCPLPTAEVPPDEIEATLQDWLREFERVHLLLRLSPKLRERYND
ncbi:MAG: thioredoxin family protein [Planctomycetota bacterium]|nr:thioredoxin family protein [Planctomycetota bacterium]